MRKICALLAMLAVLGFSPEILAEEKPVVNITSEFDIFQLFGPAEESSPAINLPKISCSARNKYNLRFEFSGYPLKVVYKMQPQMLKAIFWEGAKGEYTVRLAGVGTNVSYKCKLLEGEADTLFLLMLDTKFLKPKHFDVILDVMRKSAPIEIEGYVYDKEKDFILDKREDLDSFIIQIILHPVSLNGIKILD